MSDKSSIEWTDATWNPIRGTKGRHHCVRISEGCKHCYAATMNHRFKGPDYVKGADTPRLDEEALLQPLRWKAPRRIFVCSMTDLFMDEHDDNWIDQVFAVMACAPQHTFQVLTKRSGRMGAYFADDGVRVRVACMIGDLIEQRVDWQNRKSDDIAALAPGLDDLEHGSAWPLPNVWLGVSAENQARADERIPDLLATPAAVRFVSAEPLLGETSLHLGLMGGACGRCSVDGTTHVIRENPCPVCGSEPYPVERLDWVIVGGESGPGARPCDVSWIRSIKDQCADADVPCFVKQLGSKPTLGVLKTGAGNEWDNLPVDYDLKDKKGGDPAEWPSDLRVRQMPGETQ